MNLTLNNFLMRLKTGYVQVLLLAISVVLTYGHTLDVPFYLDDFSSIQEIPSFLSGKALWLNYGNLLLYE